MTPDEISLLRRHRIIRALFEGTPTDVDGVTFDLSGHAIDFETLLPLTHFAERLPVEGPLVSFPWTPIPYLRALTDAGTPVYAGKGDRLGVSRVEQRTASLPFGDFEADDEKTSWSVTLQIRHADGTTEEAPNPLVYVKRGSALVHAGSSYGDIARGLVHRLAARAGKKGPVDDPLIAGDMEDLADLERALAGDYRRALQALAVASEEIDLHAAVAFGYFMSRAELGAGAVVRALRSKEAVAAGGRAASRSKTEFAAEWRAHARALARSIFEKGQVSSGSRMASLVLEEWGSAPDAPNSVAPETLAKFLNAEFEEQLRKGTKPV
jgi:hypothetical protein